MTRNSGPIQALLADVYMDALSDRELRGDVLRERLSTLAAAIKEEKSWESEADPNRREWGLQYGFFRPTPDWYGLVCWTCKYGGHRFQDCPTKWGGDPRSLGTKLSGAQQQETVN